MSNSEDTSSSDSSSDENLEKDLLSRAEKLESELSINKYSYDVHIEVINVYRELTDLNSMRQAYQRFHQCFPLTPKIWLEWIKDEIKIANTKEEQINILNLFDKAVEDYLSVDLWMEYAKYSLDVNGLPSTRTILERGVTSVGLHVAEGSLLWDTLRGLEHAHISLYEENSEEWVAQIKRLGDIFKRQLSVPLMDMENTYQEWTEWHKSLPEGLLDPKPIEWGYKKALQTLETYKPFEERILLADTTELHDIYKEYLKILKDPSVILCVYERALLPLCLTASLWEDYIKFSFKLREVVLKVTARAVRNCTWSENVWIARIRALEYHQQDEKEILTCFEQGILNVSPSPSLELWFSLLEYYHRNSKDSAKIDKLFSQALEQISSDNDPTYKISRWYARLLAKRGDMESARTVWTNIMSNQQIKSSANAWLEYANLEKQYGGQNQARNIFKRALVSCRDWSHYIADEWLMFEREFGSLEDIMKCEEKCKNIVISSTSNYEKSEDISTSRETSKEKSDKTQRGPKRKYESSAGRAAWSKKQEHEEDYNVKRLRISQDSDDDKEKSRSQLYKPIDNKDPKTTVFVSNLHPNVNEQKLKELFPNALNINVVFDRKGKSRCFGYVQFSKEEECMTALARDRIPIDGRPVFISELKSDKSAKKIFKYAQTSEENKLFVKGIPVTKSKEDVEEIFKSYNPTDVRLVCKRNGQSKGIAYVEFKTSEEAKKALKGCNSLKIDDHEIIVAISAPPPKQSNDKPELNEPIRHARSRLQVPMMPRTLLVKSTTNKSQINEKESTSNKGPKSNADFRNMFLKN